MNDNTLHEIRHELQNWNGLPKWFEFFLRILSGLPGGEPLEEAGIEPLDASWREVVLLVKWLSSIDTPSDVRQVVDEIQS